MLLDSYYYFSSRGCKAFGEYKTVKKRIPSNSSDRYAIQKGLKPIQTLVNGFLFPGRHTGYPDLANFIVEVTFFLKVSGSDGGRKWQGKKNA